MGIVKMRNLAGFVFLSSLVKGELTEEKDYVIDGKESQATFSYGEIIDSDYGNYGNYGDSDTLNLVPCDERCNTHLYFKCKTSIDNDVGKCCINKEFICNNETDCDDGSDEEGCENKSEKEVHAGILQAIETDESLSGSSAIKIIQYSSLI